MPIPNPEKYLALMYGVVRTFSRVAYYLDVPWEDVHGEAKVLLMDIMNSPKAQDRSAEENATYIAINLRWGLSSMFRKIRKERWLVLLTDEEMRVFSQTGRLPEFTGNRNLNFGRNRFPKHGAKVHLRASRSGSVDWRWGTHRQSNSEWLSNRLDIERFLSWVSRKYGNQTRRAFVRFYREGYSSEEVAKELRITASGLYSRFHRIVHAYRELLAKPAEERKIAYNAPHTTTVKPKRVRREIAHGTLSGYRYCKCELCRQAKRESNRKHWEKRLAEGTHGAVEHYDKGCRCTECRRAKAKYWQDKNALKQGLIN